MDFGCFHSNCKYTVSKNVLTEIIVVKCHTKIYWDLEWSPRPRMVRRNYQFQNSKNWITGFHSCKYHVSVGNNNITTTSQTTTNPYAYFMGYIVEKCVAWTAIKTSLVYRSPRFMYVNKSPISYVLCIRIEVMDWARPTAIKPRPKGDKRGSQKLLVVSRYLTLHV